MNPDSGPSIAVDEPNTDIESGVDGLTEHVDPEGGDSTLGGYVSVHSRPPAFEGCDHQPYTVSTEVEQVADPRAPYVGYLVFPRWAETGLGIVGHVETPILCEGRARDEVRERLESMDLAHIKALLDQAITRKYDQD